MPAGGVMQGYLHRLLNRHSGESLAFAGATGEVYW
jgi:hypothetical protein